MLDCIVASIDVFWAMLAVQFFLTRRLNILKICFYPEFEHINNYTLLGPGIFSFMIKEFHRL